MTQPLSASVREVFVTLFDSLTGEIPGTILASASKNPPVSVPVIAIGRMDFVVHCFQLFGQCR